MCQDHQETESEHFGKKDKTRFFLSSLPSSPKYTYLLEMYSDNS